MTTFVETQCCNCGIQFCVPDYFDKERRARGEKLNFYCPNGHSLSYREGKEDALRRERDRLAQRQAQLQDELAEAKRLQADAEAKADKAQRRLKRAGERIHRGVCPHCNRTFVQLARHMASKHPGASLVAEVA